MKTRHILTAAGLGLLLFSIFIGAARAAGAAAVQSGVTGQAELENSNPAKLESASAVNTWYTETADSGAGLFTSLTMVFNIMQISYFDVNNGRLLFAQSSQYKDWFTETVDILGPGNASYTALAIDPVTFVPKISYHDFNNDSLNYADREPIWVTETVNSPGGNYNALALDFSKSPSRTVPHVSYYEQNKGDLIHASQDAAGTWFTTTVDSAGNVGLYTSIDLDGLGYPNISYYDNDRMDLKWAYWDGSNWKQQTVDSTGDVGWDTSLGIDSAGNVHISYHDVTNGNLNYAFYDQLISSWVTETVDSTGNVGWYTSLALDSNDLPHISYYDASNNQLNYATLAGSTWMTETVDASSADTGRFSSLTLDYLDRPHISYFDGENDRLMFATNYPRAGDFTVNDNADGPAAGDSNPGDGICLNQTGKCTLRAAIEEANAWPGEPFDLIGFKSAMTITLSDILPGLTSPVFILGEDVWDYNKDQPGIKIDGNQLATGLKISSDECHITGLYLTNFSSSAISITGGDNIIGGELGTQRNVLSGNAFGIIFAGDTAKNNRVTGNYIGLAPNGSAAEMNGTGIVISQGASNNIIGGDNANQGNVISGNEIGIWIGGLGTNNNKFGGNLIGVKPDGTSSLKNERDGIYVTDSADGTCIGCGSLAANTIRNNGGSGIQIREAGLTTIRGNDISGNNNHGIFIDEGSDNQVISNTIHGNAEDGVRVYEKLSTENTISENSITGNGLSGINLILGANRDIVAPIVQYAAKLGASGTACAACTIEIFSDDLYQGRIYEGDTIADNQGHWQYSGALTGPNVTATATDADGNTSRFSWDYFDIRKLLIYLPLVQSGN